MMRFAEMLRGGGTLDGQRIVSRALVERARTIWTGDKPNEFYANGIRAAGGIAPPANIGLGFSVRGPQMGTSMFGTLGFAGHLRCARRRAPRFSGSIRSATSVSSD